MHYRDLQRLCVHNKLKANGTSVSMAAALEVFRCSAVAVADGGSAAEEDGED